MHDNLYNECIAVLKFKVKRMNKLEYIPGDLGTYNGNIVIIENSDGYYATYYDEDEFLQEVNVNAIESIPLTPAILEKNGWKRNGGQYSFTYKPYAGDRVELIGFFIEMFKDVHDMLKHRYFQITHEDKVICGCFYVHQLQHHLFGLGINHEMEV